MKFNESDYRRCFRIIFSGFLCMFLAVGLFVISVTNAYQLSSQLLWLYLCFSVVLFAVSMWIMRTIFPIYSRQKSLKNSIVELHKHLCYLNYDNDNNVVSNSTSKRYKNTVRYHLVCLDDNVWRILINRNSAGKGPSLIISGYLTSDSLLSLSNRKVMDYRDDYVGVIKELLALFIQEDEFVRRSVLF